MLKLSSNVSDVFPKVLKLSCEVSECKPLTVGREHACDGMDGGHLRRGGRHTRGAGDAAQSFGERFDGRGAGGTGGAYRRAWHILPTGARAKAWCLLIHADAFLCLLADNACHVFPRSLNPLFFH